MNLFNRARIVFRLVRRFGIRKLLEAHRASASDSNFFLTVCPKCSTEHRIHAARVATSMIKCTNCKALFVVTNQTPEETAFMATFGHGK